MATKDRKQLDIHVSAVIRVAVPKQEGFAEYMEVVRDMGGEGRVFFDDLEALQSGMNQITGIARTVAEQCTIQAGTCAWLDLQEVLSARLQREQRQRTADAIGAKNPPALEYMRAKAQEVHGKDLLDLDHDDFELLFNEAREKFPLVPVDGTKDDGKLMTN